MTTEDYGIVLGEDQDGYVYIARIIPGSLADGRMAEGERIMTVEGRFVGDASEASSLIEDAWSYKTEVDLSLSRGGKEVWVQLQALDRD